jgi:signal transduction histidine kinase
VPKILEVVCRATGMGFAAHVAALVHRSAARMAALIDNILDFARGRLGDDIVTARSDDGGFELSVANFGEPIPRDTLARLFQPYARASARPYQQGLGLGRYIASEIARAHDGTLEVASTPEETRFTLRMPTGSAVTRRG